MKQVINLTPFVLLLIGTVGLLINELVFDWGRVATLSFAALNVVGLGIFAFTTWGIKNNS